MNIELTLPESWNDIRLEQYQEFILTDFDEMQPIEKMFRVISILCDVSEDNIRNISIPKLHEIVLNFDFIQTKPNKDIYKYSFEIEGVRYASIKSFNHIKVGEWVDIENLLEDYKLNIHKILAIIYRPITFYIDDSEYEIEDYNIETRNDRALLFQQHLSATDAITSSVFFWIFVSDYLANMKDYLTLEMNRMKKDMKD
jgi:hypothetical protein